MKKRYIAMIMGIVFTAASMPLSAQEMDGTQKTIVGEVTAVGSNFIEIRETGGGNPQGDEAESADGTEETDQITVVSLTDETQFFEGGMMQMPENGEMPAEPDGEPSENGEVPAKPDGEPSDDGEIPAKPDGESSDNGEMPGQEGMPDGGQARNPGQAEEISLDEIETGDIVMITLDEDGNAQTVNVQSGDMMPGGAGAGMDFGDMDGNGGQPGGMAPGQSQGPDSYDAVTEITEDTSLDGEQIDSTGADENAVLVSGSAQAELSNLTVTRTSQESTGGDDASFYGVGAAVLAAGGTTYLSDSTIATDASGGAGVFAYGDGVVYVDSCTIDTQQDTSGGIHVAGGGTLYAWNTTAETDGRSAAAVRSDRGGGTMVVDGGSYTSNGSDSPAVYCTADISIHDAELTANGSEAVCIEGLNTLRLYDCDLTGNMSDDDRNENTWTVIVYQSMSGDSQEGNGTFQMEGGTLTSGNGGIFYTTNTESTILLKNVSIQGAEDSEFFLQCTGNVNSRGWGSAGSNGADCLFTGVSQQMSGDVIWDSISTLDFYLTEGSSLTGAIRRDDTYASGGSGGSCNVVIDAESEWIVTGDSEVTGLFVGGQISDASGRTVTVMGTDGTVYAEGDSDYTITVETYSTDADLSGAASGDSWEEHAADLPV